MNNPENKISIDKNMLNPVGEIEITLNKVVINLDKVIICPLCGSNNQ